LDFKLRYFRYPWAIYRRYRGLLKSQWHSPEQLAEIQASGLRSLVNHCYRDIPYYRRLFEGLGLTPDDIRGPEDLPKLPLLTKQEVRDNSGALLAPEMKKYHPVLMRTGGTTGTALQFYVDRFANMMEFATVWRHWGWAGYRFGDRFCDLRGRIIKTAGPWSYDARLNALFLSSYRLTRELVPEYARKLRRFKPRILRGYPSAINFFAQLLREAGIDDIRPRAVVTSSETLLAHQRQNLEEVFGCRVFDTYGLEERCCAAGQCPEGGFHIDSEYGILGVVDGAGRPVAPGEEGEIVATGLATRVMPFLNYRTNDLARLSTRRCSCGRGLPLIESITGRVEDMVVTPDGRSVSGAGLSVALKYSPGIRLSQILQDTVEEMTVRIVRAPGYGEDDEKKLLINLRDRVGEAIKIRLDYVDDIGLTAAGKLKFVISKPGRVRA